MSIVERFRASSGIGKAVFSTGACRFHVSVLARPREGLVCDPFTILKGWTRGGACRLIFRACS
eukprot:4942712-Prymnesium_polylepis.1